MIGVLASQGSTCWVVPISTGRSLPVEQTTEACRVSGLESIACSGIEQAYQLAIKWAEKEGGMVCITGSLYLAGEVLKEYYGE